MRWLVVYRLEGETSWHTETFALGLAALQRVASLVAEGADEIISVPA